MFKRMIFGGCVAISLLTLISNAQSAPTTKPSTGPASQAAAKEIVTKSGLKIVEVAPGDPAAREGDVVFVHYTGTLKDGTKFDSSIDREPIHFRLGRGAVIQGWDEGIVGMKVGQKRTLIIPPELGYRAEGKKPYIPPNAELHFDVELVGLARVPE